jgi:hypothetical protein
LNRAFALRLVVQKSASVITDHFGGLKRPFFSRLADPQKVKITVIVKLLHEQKRLLAEGLKAEALKLDKAVEQALLDILESATEAELALVERHKRKEGFEVGCVVEGLIKQPR